MNLNQKPLAKGIRAMTLDHASHLLTYDQATPVMDTCHLIGPRQGVDQYPINPGKPLGYGPSGTRGGIQTWDGKTVDSTGAFLVGELERMDMKMHEPLVMTSWGRDIDLREDVTIADEISSFTLSTFASAGSLGTGQLIGTGKAWIGKATDQISGVGVDVAKVPNALTPWALELKYDILELESSAKVGRPVDQQKYAALQMKHQMDVDEQVYFGDTSLSQTGLVNSSLVTPVAVGNGAAGSPLWTQKTPAEILTDFNTALTTVWEASAWARIPNRVLLPTSAYGYIATQQVSLAGDRSILTYIEQNNLFSREGKGQLGIFPAKWCNGTGAGGTVGVGAAGKDRMVVYTKEVDSIRFPMTLLQRTPVQYDGLYHKTTYFCRLGVVEVVYPQMVGYFDGIS